MKVGHAHNWRYHGHMKEKKYPGGIWRFFWRQKKYRAGRKYFRGVKTGTGFHWKIEADQYMRKTGHNKYSGFMKGIKRFIKRY